ncbi:MULTISPECIES: glycosyltransferase [unclassified Saccharopolyspora]|uniref:glycosyltransferase n=1 Tax=unclassified Saccharopolyspora TaxID=2646250 RepID=UPI001CD6B63F|nr:MULTISPECIES: glycosyltransferase [unclassified Saccharopolyspora]MCA1185676.1 glycosyltransferase [Saccharopolyspora sp. 6T]MCA1191465.1 glycosyltransferase [Saccharopolyspora sp. 6V]MCA1226860.1 glycosyltransferase [Saccharopolyspora sp. 6M]MCA1280732.1 glycosyltransferase [Saccharopolyspora sp. 7B]
MNRPPRVATVITRLEGGAGAMALRGALALDRREFDVTVITGSGGRLLRDAAAAGAACVLEPSLRAPIAPADDLRALLRLTALLRRGSFDVVHTHCAKAGALGRVAAVRAGMRRIVHSYHGFPFHEFQRAPRRRTYLAVERALGRVTDVALCVGTGVAVEAVRRGLIAPDRVRTTGVAVPPVPVDPKRARRELGLPAAAVVVGAVGRLVYQKAPEDWVAALAALRRPDVTGVWIGDGERAARVRAAAARLGARVVLAGDRADAPELVPAFDVFVQPSRYEGLPLAVVEAMSAGVPVVATAVNAIGDVVVPGVTGLLVPPARPDLLASAVSRLLADPELAAGLATAARQRVLGAHTAAALAADLAAAYRGEPVTAAATGSDRFGGPVEPPRHIRDLR